MSLSLDDVLQIHKNMIPGRENAQRVLRGELGTYVQCDGVHTAQVVLALYQVIDALCEKIKEYET